MTRMIARCLGLALWCIPSLSLAQTLSGGSLSGGSIGAAAGSGGGGSFACNDGLDNDGDGITDYPGDAGCSSPSDNDESGDSKVVVTTTTSAASLESTISSQPAGPVTVCGGTGTTCDGTLRTINSGGVDIPRDNVSLNNLHLTGSISCQVANGNTTGCRLVNSEAHEVYCRGTDYGVVQNSLLDGRIDGGSQVLQNQLWDDPDEDGCKYWRFVGNTIQNYQNSTGTDHSEGIYTGGWSEAWLVKDNTFINVGSTGQFFLTAFGVDYIDGGPNPWETAPPSPKDFCFTGNTFILGTAAPCAPGCEPFGRGFNGIAISTGNYAGRTVSLPYESNMYIDEDPSEVREAGDSWPDGVDDWIRSCMQCNDGLDNDGDGYFDQQDPQCSSWTDNDESN